MKSAPIVPSIGAAQVLVLKNVVGMMFWICGVPGSASMVKVKAPSAIVAGDQPLGDVALAEHLGGERIDREHDDEQRHAAIGQQRADQHDRQHGALAPDQLDHRGDDGLGEARKLDHLAEDGAEQEHGKVQFFTKPTILSMNRPVNIGGTSDGIGQQHGTESRHRREQDDAEAAIGDEHQKGQCCDTDKDVHRHKSSHCRLRPGIGRSQFLAVRQRVEDVDRRSGGVGPRPNLRSGSP